MSHKSLEDSLLNDSDIWQYTCKAFLAVKYKATSFCQGPD